MKLRPNERLIVALDFKKSLFYEGTDFSRRSQAMAWALGLCEQLAPLGVVVKFNSIARACGFELIERVHNLGLKVFLDWKLNDIPGTLEMDGWFLHDCPPYLLTIMASTGGKGIHSLKKSLPETELLAVTVLTSLEEIDTEEIHGGSIDVTMARLSDLAVAGGADGIILSPAQLQQIKNHPTEGVKDLSLNCPGVRPQWWLDEKGRETTGQNESRIRSIKQAFMNGAHRVVIGSPIVLASDPLEATKRTLQEISEVF